MRRIIVLIAILLPVATYAHIPAIEQLGKEMSKYENVEYDSVGSVMLGMAQTFASKEQRSTFKMLDHIDLIVCKSPTHEKSLEQRTLAITRNIGAEYLVTSTDQRGRNDVYVLKQGDVVKEVIIITHGKDGGLGVVAMSGTIPIERLGELSTLSRPDKR